MSKPAPSTKLLRRSDSPWITVKEAAEYLGVSTYSIYEACASRGLKHAKLGHSTIRLRQEWLDEWVESRVR